MIKEAIGTGATIDEAKDAALALLGAPDDAEITFETLAMPTKKTLGLFGGSPAKVKVSYEVPDEKPAPVKEPVRQAPKAAPAAQKAPEKKAAPVPEKKTVAPARAADDSEKPVAYLKSILAGMGFEDAQIKQREDGEELIYEIECGNDYGNIIGRRGETLDAIQYLTRLVANREPGDHRRISLNVGDYREKREGTLRALAKRNAQQVSRYGKNVVLEPMNPYERRIIHTAVQEIEGVESHSIGTDDNRRVVITLAEGAHPTGGSRPPRGGQRNDFRERRPAPASAQDGGEASRAPKSDSTSAARYGKIEIPKKDV
ncbi:MAG: protein jag [Clostridiales bacterium]|nr:protein jag [Clostridiales bacterium]